MTNDFEKIAWNIPVERLYVIGRVNMKRFLDKWGINPTNYYRTYGTTEERNRAVILLTTPEELPAYELFAGVKWIGRASAVIGMSLKLAGYDNVGNILTLIWPSLEAVGGFYGEICEIKKEEWKEFLEDSETLLDNYHELIGIIKISQNSCSNREEVKKMFKNLEQAIYDFLKECDENNDETIEVSELETSKEELAKNLHHNWKTKKESLKKVMKEIQNLEEKLIHYRQGIFDYEEKEVEIIDNSQNENHHTINIENEQQQALQIQPTYGTPSSSKK